MRLNLKELEVRTWLIERLFLAVSELLETDYRPELSASLDFDTLFQLREAWRELRGSMRESPCRINPVMEAAFFEEGETLDGPPIPDELVFLGELFGAYQEALEAVGQQLLRAARQLELPIVDFLEKWMFTPLFQLEDPVELLKSLSSPPRRRMTKPNPIFEERVIAEAFDPDFFERVLDEEDLDRVLIRN